MRMNITMNRTRRITQTLIFALIALLSVGLLGCGEDDPGDTNGGNIEENENENEDIDRENFATTPISYTAKLGAGNGELCVDIDSGKPVKVDCEDAADDWDLMFKSLDRSWTIWTNGGVYGVEGNMGASIGPFNASEIEDMTSGAHVPGWFPDYYGGIFATYPWQTYDVMGTHDITANNRVYVIDTGADTFRLQITSYYNEGVSGLLNLRYGNITEETYQDIEIDARGNGFGAADGQFTYFDLDAGALVDIDDDTARESNTEWDIGFKRFDVILNGGVSGTGQTTGAIADAQDALYDENGDPIRSEFEAQTDAMARQAFEDVTSADELAFVSDSAQPFVISDGSPQSWFGVIGPPPIPPTFEAHSQHWWMVRGSKGESYVKMRATDIEFLTQSFTFDMHIQASPEAP